MATAVRKGNAARTKVKEKCMSQGFDRYPKGQERIAVLEEYVKCSWGVYMSVEW
jgi:hypothetical protein